MASPAQSVLRSKVQASGWNRTRGGCGVTLGAGDLVLRERELPVSGAVQRMRRRWGMPSPFGLSRWGRSVLGRDLQVVVGIAKMRGIPQVPGGSWISSDY